MKVAEEHCQGLLSQAQEIASKFQRVFQLFRDCHVLYDTKAVSEEDVKQLVKGFLA